MHALNRLMRSAHHQPQTISMFSMMGESQQSLPESLYPRVPVRVSSVYVKVGDSPENKSPRMTNASHNRKQPKATESNRMQPNATESNRKQPKATECKGRQQQLRATSVVCAVPVWSASRQHYVSQ